jgi:hypothetical protein
VVVRADKQREKKTVIKVNCPTTEIAHTRAGDTNDYLFTKERHNPEVSRSATNFGVYY